MFPVVWCCQLGQINTACDGYLAQEKGLLRDLVLHGLWAQNSWLVDLEAMNRQRGTAAREEAGEGQAEETGVALESVGTFVSGLEAGTGNASDPIAVSSQQGNGDLFNLAPLEPLNLAALGRGEQGEVPGLRRVVVSEGSEEMVADQGPLVGPVGGLPPMTAPPR